MSKKYINEAVSMNGKVAFNENNVSFKTNSVDGILQHLAWQYNETFLGTVKKFKFDETTGLIGNAVLKLSSNGSPMIFDELSEHKVSFDIEAGETVTILHLKYSFMDDPELMQYVDVNQIEFVILIVNGIWVLANKVDNGIFFEKFINTGNSSYVSTDLPTVKIPKVISEIDNVGVAKSALKAFAKEQGLTKYAISSFTPTEGIEILANPSISKFSTFMPDLREFSRTEAYAEVKANTEIPYLVDEDNGRLLFINLGSSTGNKWHLIQDKSYINFITGSGQGFFVDSVKNAVISSELNQGVKIKEIYDLIGRQRAVILANGIQPMLDKHGYFISSEYSKTITQDKFSKVSVDSKGNATQVINTKPLIIYRDTIVLYSINLENNIVVISLPKEPETLYVTIVDQINELFNEFINYDAYYDTVLSINDAYFFAEK